MAGPVNIKDAQANNYVAALAPDASRARVEIEEFLGDNAMTNLYLLALEDMQKEDPTKSVANRNEDWWTYYSLSGIHGQPAERWNGIANPLKRDGNGSYCTHGQLVFPTWHRVYINMFEQAVANKIQTIADQFTNEPEKSIYQSAAKRFRLPFWDPYLPRNKVPKTNTVNEKIWGFPKILAVKKVWVKRPKETVLKEIDNPLYAFTFPNEALDTKARTPVAWSAQPVPLPQGKDHTIRSPDSKGETNIYGVNANDRTGLELRLQRQAKDSFTKLWKLLSRYTDEHNNDLRSWASFATHNLIDPTTNKPVLEQRVDTRGKPVFDQRGNPVMDPVYQGDTSVSLESWHDTIHGLIGTGVGSGGHMGYPPIAGFDPIFWLHHCNVDRLLAIYQALYPDKWLQTADASADLYPFKKNATVFWKSNDVRDWKTLGYAIPGNKDLDDKGRLALEKHLHEYYNWTTEGSFPPASVTDNWPRDLSTSIALYGTQAKPVTRPVVKFEALNVSKLVSRTLAIPTQDALKVEVVDQPKDVIIEDSANKPEVNPPETVKDGSMLTWNARVRVKKFAFNGSFNIHLFIGHIKDDQTERFVTKKNEVGFTGVFATPPEAPCSNCAQQRQEGIIYEDAIPITPSLFAYLRSNDAPETDGPPMDLRTLTSFEPEQVAPFLRDNLAWRLTDMASNLLDDPQALIDSGLEITVSARKFGLPTPEQPLGVYYPAQSYRDVTDNKLGGFGHHQAGGAASS